MRTISDWIAITIVGLLALVVFGVTSAHAEVEINIDRIIQIESAGNPGAFNPHSNSRGLCQITPVCLKEYNALNHTHYTSEDLFGPQINMCVGYWYLNERIPALLRHFHIKDSVENRLRAYNSGIKTLLHHRLPLETRKYIEKYNKGA